MIERRTKTGRKRPEVENDDILKFVGFKMIPGK